MTDEAIESTESALPAEAEAAIEKINNEREEELRMQSPHVQDEGDDVSSPEVPEVADESSGQQPEQPQVDDEITSRAKAFGLDPSKYSPEDLQSRLDDFDRMFSAKGQQALQAWQQQRQSQPMPQQMPTQQPPQAGQQQQQPPQVPVIFELDEEYGELKDKLESGAQKMQQQFYGILNSMASHMLQQEQVIQQWRQAQQQEAVQREATEFHEAVQSLGDTVFGKKQFNDLKPDSAEAKALGQLGDQVRTMALGLRAAGLPVPPMKELVTRAYRVAFHDRIEAQLREQQNKRMQEASRTRMGGGSRVAAPHGYNPPATDDIVNDPKLKEAFEMWSS